MSLAVLLGSGVVAGTALADEPTTTEPVPTTTSDPTTTPAESAPPSSEPSEPAPTSSVEPPAPAPTTTTPPSPPPSQPSSAESVEPAEPGPAEPAEDVADLKVLAAFDKRSYLATDRPRVTVTIENLSDVAAEGVRGSGGGDLDVWGTWGELATKRGVRIEPHSSRVVELSGRILDATDGTVAFDARVGAERDANPNDNATFVEVPITAVTGVFAGAVLADVNDDGTIGSGEGLSGVRITLSQMGPSGFTQTTDAQGRFSFADIPAGHYVVDYSPPSPWFVSGLSGRDFDSLDIDDSGRYANVSITAVQALRQLRVGLKFDRASYAPGDTTSVAVTMVNTSDRDIAGITARCQSFSGSPDLTGGPGWGALADGAAGVTVPARGTKVVEVTEAVPAESPRYGYVSAFCFFGPAGHPDRARASGSATAKVPGATAPAKGQLGHDLNHNFIVDEGEQVPGVRIALADQDTGATVTEADTGTDGRYQTPDVPVGVYELRIIGPWVPDNCVRTVTIIAGFDLSATCMVVPGQQSKRPNLRVSAEFTQPAYESGDTIRVNLTISNVGDGDAEAVKASSIEDPAALFIDQFGDGWGELNQFGPGVRLLAGETRVFDIFGTARNPDAGTVTFTGSVFSTPNNDSYFQNNFFDIAASVTKTTGRYNGTIFVDHNGNGRPDTGEGLGGILVFIFGGVPVNPYSQTTNAEGKFDFGDLPTGNYGASFEDPTGKWVPIGESGNGFDRFVLDKSGHRDVLIRAVAPLSNFLVPTLKFTKDSYAEGELAQLTVTLTNNGTVELTGITAICRTEAPSGLRGGPGWEPLAEGSAGVSLPAGATLKVQVAERVPEGSRSFGNVFAACSFGAAGHLGIGYPHVFAEAKVPGAIGSGVGRLAQRRDESDQEGTPVADTKVVLLDPGTGQPVAKTRTGTDGRFQFRDLPVGRYALVVVGPWRIVDEFRHDFFIHEGGSDHQTIWLEPGPEQADPFPDVPDVVVPPAPPAPQPQGSAAPAGLASTGASVVELLVVSLSVVLIGFGTVLATRRRARRQG
jgi:hypothetical protein